MYKPTTLKKILAFFDGAETIGVTELANRSGLSRTILHKYIKELLAQGRLEKVGTESHTRYKRTDPKKKKSEPFPPLEYTDQELLDDIFLKFTPKGKELTGYEGLAQWCQSRNINPLQAAKKYIAIYKRIQIARNDCGLLDATENFQQHIKDIAIDTLYYADQYTWKEFGRGKTAELTFYAKQSQSRTLLHESIELFIDKIICYLHHHPIDALAFIPPSITRQWQLLAMIDAALHQIDLPRIRLKKFYEGEVKIPQKSLKNRSERIENAKETIYVYEEDNLSQYKDVLLIDDFVGSGSTLNETAKKLKNKGVKKVIGFAIVGNMDLSYEVINEV